MKTYKIIISEQARNDLKNLAIKITIDYNSPLTSKKYLDEIRLKINSLEHGAESYVIQTRPFYRQYGFNVRAIYYKKMTIVYLVVDNLVYIRAVIISDSIRGL
jgi:hypothetical protein